MPKRLARLLRRDLGAAQLGLQAAGLLMRGGEVCIQFANPKLRLPETVFESLLGITQTKVQPGRDGSAQRGKDAKQQGQS